METINLARTKLDPTSEDEASMVKVAQSDPAVFSRLYRRYVTPVYRYLYKWVGNPAEAEDLTSQVFTEVLEKLVDYREQGNFAAWLFTIARRKAIAAYRQRPNLPLDEDDQVPEPAEDPLEWVIQGEQLKQMAALFAGLDEDQRELLRLRFTADLEYAEIGALLGRSEAAVKMAVYRLLSKMNEKWEE